MGDDLRGEEQLDFDVAERVLEKPDVPAERQRPPRYTLLRRAGRITAAALPSALIVAIGAVNLTLIKDTSDTPPPADQTASLPGRESLAEAPGHDALGLRERFSAHDQVVRARKRGGNDNTDRILRGGLTLPARGAPVSSGSGHIASGSSGAPTQGAPASSGSKSSGAKPAEPKPKPEPEPIPEPSAVLYRMWNSDRYDHYFTTNPEERDRLLNEGYRTYATEGLIFPTQERGTYPIHTDNGVVGYAFGKKQDNTVPLYFLRGPNGEGDLFTTSTETKDRWHLQKGWDYLGIAGYIGRWGPP